METSNIVLKDGQSLPYMNTLTACVNKLTKNGYTDSFVVTGKGLHSNERDKTYGPEDVKVVDFYRFEGQSDPADNAIMYAVETRDGSKGMIIDAFGHYADDIVTRFMKHVEEISKNVDKKNAA